jgi:hypothetical protein
MIVMLCHIGPTNQEVCIPMVENPPVYYEQKNNVMMLLLKKEMK